MGSFKKSLIILSFLFISFSDFAQTKDTLTVMTYNLMYYRETTSFCTSSNNSTTTKEAAMEDIVDYTLPDILVVNEMGGGSVVNPFRLLSNSLNRNGRTYYSMANSSGNGSSLVNMLYYDSRKLVLEDQSTVTQDLNGNNLVRLIDIYTLYYNDINLAMNQDTNRIYMISAHLKAGSTTQDELERAKATEAVMARLDSMNATGNYIIAGDFNLYSSTEPAYQDLVAYSDPTLRFFDPVNVSGNWHNNGVYAILHTQSTRSSGGCFAGGGMDDRFDFILISDEIKNNTDNLKYIPGTYEALGQDGNRFNQTIISPANNSVPSVVSQALYNMSDHLPVIMDVEVSVPGALSVPTAQTIFPLKFANPAHDNLLLDFSNQKTGIIEVEILDISGKLVQYKKVNGNHFLQFDLSGLKNGTYLIKVTDENHSQKVEKLVKL